MRLIILSEPSEHPSEARLPRPQDVFDAQGAYVPARECYTHSNAPSCPIFTHKNTSGYTDQQLAELNERYEHALAIAGPIHDGTRAQIAKGMWRAYEIAKMIRSRRG
jgi:hypothetical protein